MSAESVAAVQQEGSLTQVPQDGGDGYQPGKPLSKAIRTFYGVGDFGFTLMSNVETYYFVFFLTNFALFDPATAALISGIGAIVDAVLGWMYGGFINSLRPMRWGRYRSWLLVMPWIVPILYCLEFTTIAGNTALGAFLIIFFNVTSHAAWDFPYAANVSMIAVAGKTPEDRAHMAATRSMWANASKIAFSYLLPPVALLGATLLGEANQYALCAFLMGVVMAVLYYVHFRMFKGYEKEYTKEELEELKKNKVADVDRTTFADLGRALVSNRPLIFLILADIAKWVFNFMCAGIAIYYFTYVVFEPGMLAMYILISNVLCVVGSFLSDKFAKVVKSSRNGTIFAFIFMAAMLVIARVQCFDMWTVIFFMSLAQFGYGIIYALIPALYADTVVYAEWKLRKNAAGWISGLQIFPLKLGFVARSIVVPGVLALSGFVSGMAAADATMEIQLGICNGFMLIPAALLVVSAVLLFFGFNLTHDKLRIYQSEIDERRAALEALPVTKDDQE